MNISCKTSAVRSSELRDRQLRGIRRLELWYHITICRVCRIYNRQIKKLGRISASSERRPKTAAPAGSSCPTPPGPAYKKNLES